MKQFLKSLVFLVIPGMLSAQDNLDPNFGGIGSITYGQQLNVSEENIVASAMNLNTGQIYMAGSYAEGGGTYAMITCYTTTGVRDMTFGGDGIVSFAPGILINAIDLNQSTGDLVVAGSTISGVAVPWIAYVSANGMSITEQTFPALNSGADASYNTVNFTPSGEIAAAGVANVGGFNKLLVSKVFANLTEDPLFGSLGHYLAPDNTTNAFVTASAINGDSLYVAGYMDGPIKDTMTLQRFIVQGASQGLELTFNGGQPVKYIPIPSGEARPGGIAILPNAKPVVAMAIAQNGSNGIAMVSYNTDGSLNNGFGISGVREISWGDAIVVQDAEYNATINSIVMAGHYTSTGDRNQFAYITSDNGMTSVAQQVLSATGAMEFAEDILYYPPQNAFYLVGGSMGTNMDLLVTKTDVNLNADFTFANNGYLTGYFFSSSEEFIDLAATSDGVLALAETFSVVSKKGVFKFDNNGMLDNSFGNAGFAEIPVITSTDFVKSITTTSSGDYLVAGKSFIVGDSYSIFIAKFTSTGQPVTSFGGVGYTTFTFHDSIHDVLDIKELPDGKIIVSAEYIAADTKHYLALIRFTPGGTIDNLFNTTGVFISTVVLEEPLAAELVIDLDPTKVICASTDGEEGSQRVSVFKVSDTGILIPSFGTAGYYTTTLGASEAMAGRATMDPAGNIYIPVVKITASNFSPSLIKLDNSGVLQTSFGTGGELVMFSVGSLSPALACKVTGENLYVLGADNGFVTLAKSDLNGVLDNAFGIGGSLTLNGVGDEALETLDMADNGNGAFYIGQYLSAPGNTDIFLSRFLYTTTSGGGGGGTLDPGISLADVNKVFGDAPFTVTANSASPEPITYSVVTGCLTYDSDAQEFVITCAGTATIRASQAANSTYAAGSIEATVSIAKGTPSIVFNNQGAVVGDSPFKLLITSESDTALAIFSVPTNSAFTITSNGVVSINAAGSELVSVLIPSTQNYVSVSASATFTVYTNPVPPDVLPTTIAAIVGDTVRIDLKEILVGNSSPIDLATIDLDPETPGVQNFFATPSEGFYSVDDEGILTFIPIYGFTGEADLNFTVSDKRGEKSSVSKLTIQVVLPSTEAIPELETKQIFTPNGDGYNDAFVIAFLDNTLTNNFVVYDRNGHEVYAVADYNNDWEGLDNNGKKLDTGIYYYLFTDELNRVAKGAIVIKH